MTKTLKNEFKLLTVPKAIMHPLAVLGGYTLGIILFLIIMRIDNDPETTFFPMGSIIAAMCGLIWAAIYSGLNLGIEYNMAVSMSCNRMQKLTAQIIMLIVDSAVRIIILYLLSRLDELIYRVWYFDRGLEFSLTELFTPVNIIAYTAVSVVAALFIAGIRNRFGRKGLLIMYFVFFGSCILLPKIISGLFSGEMYLYDLLAPVFSAIAAFMTPAVWIIAAVLICALLIAVSIRLMVNSPVVFE